MNPSGRLKILFIIGWPLNQGGHIHSTLNHIKYLVRQGHHVILLAPEGKKINEFISVGAIYFKMPEHYLLSVLYILGLALTRKVDIIHAMDYEAIKKSIFARIILRRPFVYSKAGGTSPSYKIPPVDSLIVFSSELYDQLNPKTPQGTPVYLIKERIDLEIFRPMKFKKESSTKIIFMAMRLEPQKSKWLDNLIDQIEIHYSDLSGYQFCIAGNGSLFNHYKLLGQGINQNAGCELIRFVGSVDTAKDMSYWYNSADLVIGHGRGIIEAMACGKNVIILGEGHEAELINQKNINEIAYYNFSGRHFRYRTMIQDTSLITCINGSCKPNDWNYIYVKDNYSAEVGAEKMIELYYSSHSSLKPFKIFKWLINRN